MAPRWAVAMVKELLETRIKPVIHEDGGDIEFVKMENGVVYVKMHVCGTRSGHARAVLPQSNHQVGGFIFQDPK